MAKQQGACTESASPVKSTKQLDVFSFPSGKPRHQHFFHEATWEVKSRQRRWLTRWILEGTMLGCVTNSLTSCTKRSAEEQQLTGEQDQHPLLTYNMYVYYIHACMCPLSTHGQPRRLNLWPWSFSGSQEATLVSTGPRERKTRGGFSVCGMRRRVGGGCNEKAVEKQHVLSI